MRLCMQAGGVGAWQQGTWGEVKGVGDPVDHHISTPDAHGGPKQVGLGVGVVLQCGGGAQQRHARSEHTVRTLCAARAGATSRSLGWGAAVLTLYTIPTKEAPGRPCSAAEERGK